VLKWNWRWSRVVVGCEDIIGGGVQVRMSVGLRVGVEEELGRV